MRIPKSARREEIPVVSSPRRRATGEQCCLLLRAGASNGSLAYRTPALMDGKNSIRWERENGVQAFFSARNTWVVVPQIAHCPFMAGFPFFMNLAAGYPHLQWLLVVLFS